MNEQHTIDNLTHIIREGDLFFARFEWEVFEEVAYTMPIYTGNMKANGTLSRSETLRKVVTDVKVRTAVDRVKVPMIRAKALKKGLDDRGIAYRTLNVTRSEDGSVDGFVVEVQ